MFTLGIFTTLPVLLSSHSCFRLHIQINVKHSCEAVKNNDKSHLDVAKMHHVARHSELLLFSLSRRKHILYDYKCHFCERTSRCFDICQQYRSTTWMCHVAQPKCWRIRKLVSHRIIMFLSVTHSMKRKVIRTTKTKIALHTAWLLVVGLGRKAFVENSAFFFRLTYKIDWLLDVQLILSNKLI